jgi:hypothetical protein
MSAWAGPWEDQLKIGSGARRGALQYLLFNNMIHEFIPLSKRIKTEFKIFEKPETF